MDSNLHLPLFKAVGDKDHIIWDWNGTLLDDVGHAVSTMNAILKDHQLPLLNRERYRDIFDFPVRTYYEKLGFDFKTSSFEELCHRFVDNFMATFRELPLMPEMKSILAKIHSQGKIQSVLSATDQPNLDAMISHFELDNIFRFIFGIDNKFAGSKLERGHELMKQSGIPAGKTILIGDTLHDLEVARALGIEALLISRGHQCHARLAAHHELVL